MSPLERLHAAAILSVSRWREAYPTDQPLGIYNAYVPVELFEAAGLTPVYLFYQEGERGHARAHLPAFCCWPGRSLVDQALAGDLDELGLPTLILEADMADSRLYNAGAVKERVSAFPEILA